MRNPTSRFAGALILCVAHAALPAQSATTPSPAPESRLALQQQLSEIASALTDTRQQLERSQRQMELLQSQLLAIQTQLQPPQTAASSSSIEPAPAAESPEDKLATLAEQQDILRAQVKLHDQTKVESGSKYPIRLTGLVLFNAFANHGVVDNLDVPEVAGATVTGSGNDSFGAGLRQTILGIEGVGPIVAGARTFADVNLDFFAGLSYGNFGTSAGTVRMRTASINMEWKRSSLQAGLVGPLISPLSPTSYATVAQPGMAWAGNLWTWAPQLRFEHRIPLSSAGDSARSIAFELGLWDSPSAGFSTSQLLRLPTPGELAKQPAYEGRISFRQGAERHKLQLGLGGYYDRQSYTAKSIDSWAATADWLLPLSSHFELSGEAYRGRALGGLGGGVYKDVINGTDPVTGLSAIRGLNAAGAWTQWKARLTPTLELNATIGQDSGFAADFHALTLPSNANAIQLRARNRMVVGNLIYRPKTYLILSPEYRRISTWPINSSPRNADIFTLSIGYQF